MSSDNQQVDKRMTCKFGVRCYQKNPEHHKKYKHPPRKVDDTKLPQSKRFKIDVSDNKKQISPNRKDNKPVNNNISDSEDESPEASKPEDDTNVKTSPKKLEVLNEISDRRGVVASENPYKDLDEQSFIKDKFLVDMPEDFYSFWNLCKTLKENDPSTAFQDADLFLVGPYDVLNGKFQSTNKIFEDSEFLVHWRYYYDPPEFQTVLKGNDKTGYHIGYFRDEPDENPVFMACNSAAKDGIITSMGENIFAATCMYLEERVKNCDPFKKVKVTKLLNAVVKAAENLNYAILSKTDKMRNREKKVITKSFNKIGLVVPYNKKSQLGYRELHMSDEELKSALNKLRAIDNPECQEKFCSKLQPLFTYTNIAIDECDFGTGVELGWNLLFYGIDFLNKTTARFLRNSYELLDRSEFAQIITAHMENRRKGSKLSILD